jgi:OOP family OmpA-OmpF porin
MKSLLRCLILLALASTSQVLAEAEPGQGYVSPLITFTDDDKDRGVDDGVGGGQIGIGTALSERWNIEAFIQAASFDGPAEQDQFGFGVDLQHVINRPGRFSPYLFIGIGYFEIDRFDIPKEDGGMYSAGVGFLADIFGASDVALRGEYRYRADDVFSPSMADDLVSLGLQIPFGARRTKFVDSDADGVGDNSDRCPDTPIGTPVDENGCELDSDRDGVADSSDDCPNTRGGARVDARGCEPDSDGDGVPNDLDECPSTPRGAEVDQQGCELDSDDDGVVDRLDRCPDTAAGVQVDVAGCEIKAEIRLPGVNFESNSDRLLGGAEQVLDDAAATLNKNPSIEVEVAGHTDSDGAASYNENLSERRARTVRDYLVSHGVDMNRMTVRGYGEAQPIADNSNASGKAQNRRVVLRVTSR